MGSNLPPTPSSHPDTLTQCLRWPKAQSFQTSARYPDITPTAPQQGKSILTFLKKTSTSQKTKHYNTDT